MASWQAPIDAPAKKWSPSAEEHPNSCWGDGTKQDVGVGGCGDAVDLLVIARGTSAPLVS